MSESVADRGPLASTAGETAGPHTRRTMLTGAVIASASLLTAKVAAAAEGQQSHDGPPNGLQSSLSVKPETLSLKFDNSATTASPGNAVPLLISTTSPEKVGLTVASGTGAATVGRHRENAARASSVEVQVAANAPATVWVVPQRVGPPSQPADRLTVSDGRDSVQVEVWIEPVGGRWVTTCPDGKKLPDMGIVAVHAALMRGPQGPEVVMYSPPRKSDENGTPEEITPATPGGEKWFWPVEKMDDPEIRALDLKTWTTRDLNPGREGEKPVKGNIFCSGASHLPDGRLLVAGGHIHRAGAGHPIANGGLLHLYDPKNGWTELKKPMTMSKTRWYPTVTPLPDGRMLISGGGGEGLWFSDKDYFGQIENSYEIYDKKKLTKSEVLVGDVPDSSPLAAYPAVFVMPDAAGGAMIAIVETNRAWLRTYRAGKKLGPIKRLPDMKTLGSRSYPWYGSMVLLPLHPDTTTRAILVIGGEFDTCRNHNRTVGERGKEADQEKEGQQATSSTAQLLTFNMDEPPAKMAKWETRPAKRARFLCDATLLADGKVLVSGGAAKGWANNNTDPVNEAEIYDPKTKNFTPADTATTERRYHSVALLLPDGSVLKTGSNGGFGGPKPDRTQEWFKSRTDAERYLPPYLWRPRPSIRQVVTRTSSEDILTMDHGKPVTIHASGTNLTAGSKVALIRLSAVTHGNDMGQRYVWLKVLHRVQYGDNQIIDALAPSNKAAAPPGDYMLVVVDDQDTPSVAELVRLS